MIKTKTLITLLIHVSLITNLSAQHEIDANVDIQDNLRDWNIRQKIVFKNTTKKNLEAIYLYNWSNAFSLKNSPLANRYAEEFVRKFHFASAEERGGTAIENIKIKTQNADWNRLDEHPDIIKINLQEPLPANDEIRIQLSYQQRIPESRFTGYGFEDYNVSARYWLIKPAVFHKKWLLYSHKNLGDQPQQKNQYRIQFSYPKSYQLTSSFKTLTKTKIIKNKKQVELGGNIVDTKIYISKLSSFEMIKTEYGTVKTNLKSSNLNADVRSLVIDRIMRFLYQNFGKYPFENLVIAKADYDYSPVYGLNQLPDFLRPFPDIFQYSIKFFKTASNKYIHNTMLINNRQDQWMLDAMQMSLMNKFVEKEFSNIKLLGNISKFPIINWSHAAEMDFNDRYLFLWQTMARQNFDEKINKAQDSLLRFNQRITNTHKTGLGFDILKDYTSSQVISTAIEDFYQQNKLTPFDQKKFKEHFQKSTNKDLSWFFNEYVNYKKPVDFSLKKVEKKDDSLVIKIKNKSKINLPVELVQLKNKKVIAKQWIKPFKGNVTITVEDQKADRVAVNRDILIPESYMPNNFKAVRKLTRRPFQFRVFEDIEDQHYSQLFVIPEFTYNLYDGISVGTKFYNTSILPKNFSYKLSPKLGLRSNALVGSAAIDYRHYFNSTNESAFSTQIGGNFSRFSYNFDLFFHRYSGFFNIVYRNHDYLRDNERHILGLRTVNINRDRDRTNEEDEPDYNIANLQYGYSNKDLDRYVTAFADYEVAKKFSKISFTASYRKLFESNRQINLRFFGGLFLFNDSRDSDFFSFALDRPTDYLFDYNYYGRSEESGFLSQQFIFAEGGFKSQLEPAFANQWMTTVNASTTIWNWIFAYGDAGFVKNKGESAEFLYDSGIRLNLVEEYFELFFPVYSSKGFELEQPNYEENVRFIVTLDFQTLLGLFKRKWY